MSFDYSWLIAVGILIGLSLVLTFLSEEKITLNTIFIYMTIIDAFIVSTGILPLWTLILFLLIIVSLAIMQYNSTKTTSNEG